MKKRGVVQQDARDSESWRRRAVKGLANPPLAGKISQDNKLMMMIYDRELYIERNTLKNTGSLKDA